MDHGSVPPTTEQTEERIDNHEPAHREPHADEAAPTESVGADTADHVGVRSWVRSLFSR